jgi:ribose transport system substrate-binding protein
MHRKVSVLAVGPVLTAALVLTAAACGSGQSGASSGSSGTGQTAFKAKASQKITIGYSSPVAAQPPQQQLYQGIEEAAKSLGWTPELFDADLSPGTQVSNIQTMIQQQVGAMASYTLDPGATEGAYSQAESAGIPVTGINSSGAGITASVWFEADTCHPGGPMEREAREIARNKPGARVIIITYAGVPSIDEYTQCFATAAKAAGLTVLATVTDSSDNSSGAAQLTAELLTKYPGVNAFWDYDDSAAEGASSAVLAAGKKIMSGPGTQGIQVWGNSADAAGIAALRQGRLTGTLDLNTLATGWAAVELMRDLLSGKKVASITVSSDIVDTSNVGGFVNPLQRKVTFATIPVASS